MKVSRTWLQKFFDAPLPGASELADALTFHSFEIESIEGETLDVKVLPNRSADCLSHRGIALELSAILNIPLKVDPLREQIQDFPTTNELVVEADDSYVLRHTGALIRGVKVGPSPEWLQAALRAVGQRSINNVVDALNFVMFDIGQPSGAFDAGTLKLENGVVKIHIRRAKSGERITVLTGEEYELSENTFVFTDAVSGSLLDIAGIKGGLASGVTDITTDLFLSVGNYDGTQIRRVSQALKLFTDASHRYQNRPSPELTAYGMRDLLALIQRVAGGELVGVVDLYPTKRENKPVSVSLARINGLLGSRFSQAEVADVFARLKLPATVADDTFTITPPFERVDLVIPEDLVEEVGRIMGYDTITAAELPATSTPPDQARFKGIERMKDQLVAEGFTEVSTQSFTKKGEVALANPLDNTKPALRASLEENLKEALDKAKTYAPRLLPPKTKPKLFEVGTVFPKAGEYLALQMSERVPAWGDKASTHDNLSVAKLEEYGASYTPVVPKQGAYKPFSIYPFITRDIALWVPRGTEASTIAETIRNNAGDLLVRLDQFDQFEKEGRVSLAFRLVFESQDRTLTDAEANAIMERIYAALKALGSEIR